MWQEEMRKISSSYSGIVAEDSSLLGALHNAD
jgi:hypothetical protein